MADYMGMDTSLIAAQRDAAFGQLAASDNPVSRLARKGAMGISVLMFSYMNGRFNNPKLMDALPVDLTAALGLTIGHVALDYFAPGMVPSAVAMGVDALSDGAIASYLAKLGTGFGAEARGSSSSSSSSGYEGTYGTLPGQSVGALSASEAEIYVR